MDLKLFLDPVDEHLIDENLPSSSIQKSIFINQNIMHDLDGIDLVILGLIENRSSPGSEDSANAADLIRTQLYKLMKTSGKNRVLDLGNLRNGPTAKDTIQRLQEVMAYLMQKEVIPILIGSTQDMSIGQYMGYESLDKLITILNIDAYMDLEEGADPARGFLNKIFKHDPNFLFNYVHLGYQSYFVDEKLLGMLERLYFESHRLGEFRDDFTEIEPVIRDADMVTFDISSIQSRYCPDTTQPNVFGFTGEEACQITWYAGLNDKLSSIGFYNFVPSGSGKDTASVIATMIWYFIEGYYHRKGDRNFMSNDYLIYEVAIGGEPDSIRFYKSKLSDKWWMEVNDDNSDSIFLRNKMVPCNYTDYETALNGEIPQRWIKAVSKMD